MQQFRIFFESRREMMVDRFLSEENSSGGHVNEPQLSTRGFQTKEV
jgi:hypothetical protein